MNPAIVSSFPSGARSEASASAMAASMTSQRSRNSVSRICSLEEK